MSDPRPHPPFLRYLVLSSILLTVLGLLFFYPIFSSYFRQDDFYFSYFLTREGKLNLGLVGTFFYPSTKGADLFNRIRPLSALSFVIDYSVWGANPFGFYLTNFLAHITLCILLTAISFLLFPKSLKPYALVSGALFLLYPGHLESVCWISARKSEFSTLFSTFSFLCFLVTLMGKKRAYPFALAGYILALGSKEIGIILPLVLLSFHLLPILPKESRNPTLRNLFRLHAPFWIILALYLFYRLHLFGALMGHLPTGEVSVGKIPRYLQIIIPSLFRFLAPINDEIVHPAAWWTGVVFFISTTLILPLFSLLKRRKSVDAREIFCLLWILITLFPIIPVFWVKPNLIGSRQLYMPSAPLMILLTFSILASWSGKQGRVRPFGKISLLFLALLYSVYLRPAVQNYRDVGQTAFRVQKRVIEATESDPPRTGAILLNIPYIIKGVHFAGSGFHRITSPPFSTRFIPLQYSLVKANRVLQEIALQMRGPFRVFVWDDKEQTVLPYDFSPGDEKKKVRLLRPENGSTVSSFGPDFKFQFSYEGKFTLFRIRLSLGKTKQIFSLGQANLKSLAQKGRGGFEWSPAQGSLEEGRVPEFLPGSSGKRLSWQIEALDGSTDPPILVARSPRFFFQIQDSAKRPKKENPRHRE